MKDVIKVSISGIAFIFNKDAYNVLKEYLDKLETIYSNDPDGREIIADIEGRIAELILSEQEGETVVGIELAQSVVEQLGLPDEDGSDTDNSSAERVAKRLYRNPEGAMLGGVCSGLATHFRTDTVWVRLVFFAPLLMSLLLKPFHLWGLSEFFGSLFGVFVMLYIILWIVIPMARTPRQKLEMVGDKITASSIKDKLNEEAKVVSNSVKSERAVNAWGDLMYGVGKVLQVLLKVFVVFLAFVFGMVALSLFIAMLALLFGGTVATIFTAEAFAGFIGITPIIYAVLILALILIPIILIVYAFIRLVAGHKDNRRRSGLFPSIMGVIWLTLLIFTTVVTVRNADNIREGIEYIIENEGCIRDRIDHDKEDWDEQEWEQQWREYDPDKDSQPTQSVPTINTSTSFGSSVLLSLKSGLKCGRF